MSDEPIDNLAVVMCMEVKRTALEGGFTDKEAQLMANQMYQRLIGVTE